jgi:hypothetical protein
MLKHQVSPAGPDPPLPKDDTLPITYTIEKLCFTTG